jgi:hypothetical protein
MEGLTRLVSESLARHGFDRPLDYRRLQWSRWFRCESHHSLLFVPSKPGVFAVAEEITHVEVAHVAPEAESRKPEADHPRRMLAVTQFFEDDDMAFVLDRMLSRQNPMAARLASGRYFARYVVIEDQTQRRSICNALNQWIISAAEKATGIGSHFASSLELTPATEYVPQPDDRQQSLFRNEDARQNPHVGRTLLSATADATATHVGTDAFVRPASEASGSSTKPDSAGTLSMTSPQLDSGAATNIHCPSPFPSGF